MAESELSNRLAIREELIKQGINPYPSQSTRSHLIKVVLKRFVFLYKNKTTVTVVGRIRSLRLHGGSSFGHVEDGTGRIQIFFRKDVIGETGYALLKEYTNVGDFIEITGTPFLTKTNEKTILVRSFRILTKSLAPLPDKWHGLSDIETRVRKRYLDLLMNPKGREIFITRSHIISTIRSFLNKHNFLEVDTPILQTIPGGASARPFQTFHQALQLPLYLRVAPELYLKKLLVGGFERVFEVGRCFRNEGMDFSHNPEFTQVELYAAYMDYEELMALTEKMLSSLIRAIKKSFIFSYQGMKINFRPPFDRISYTDAMKKYTGLSMNEKTTASSLRSVAKRLQVKISRHDGVGKILDEIMKKHIRRHFIQPTFLTDYPVECSPLAKRKMDQPQFVERFQLFVAGTVELCNAFSELNDPIDQEDRFREQDRLRKAGDCEAQHFDSDFIEALKIGMPPAAGLGMGIDRLTTLLTDSHSIKEVILFPTVKPKEQ